MASGHVPLNLDTDIQKLEDFLSQNPKHLSCGMVVGGYALEKLYPEYKAELRDDVLKTTDIDFTYLLVGDHSDFTLIGEIVNEFKAKLKGEVMSRKGIPIHFGVLFSNATDTLDILINNNFATLNFYLEWNIKWNSNPNKVNELLMKINNKDIFLTKDFAIFTLAHVYAVVYIFIMAQRHINRIIKIDKVLGRLLLILGGTPLYKKYKSQLENMNPAKNSIIPRGSFNRQITTEIKNLMDNYFGTSQLFFFLSEKVKKIYQVELQHYFNPLIEDYNHPNYPNAPADPTVPLRKKQYAGGVNNNNNGFSNDSENDSENDDEIEFILDEYLYSKAESMKIAGNSSSPTEFIKTYNSSLINLFEDESNNAQNIINPPNLVISNKPDEGIGSNDNLNETNQSGGKIRKHNKTKRNYHKNNNKSVKHNKSNKKYNKLLKKNNKSIKKKHNKNN